MTITYNALEFGKLSDGNGPVCTILGGIVIPERRCVTLAVELLARSDGLTSYGCSHRSSWENDPGYFPQQLGSPTILERPGVNAGDWNVIVEADSETTLRIRATGTGATPVRWYFRGIFDQCCEPAFGWQEDGSFIE